MSSFTPEAVEILLSIIDAIPGHVFVLERDGLVACIVPTLRATNIDPAANLRCE